MEREREEKGYSKITYSTQPNLFTKIQQVKKLTNNNPSRHTNAIDNIQEITLTQ
jgi:hypothetical protein